MAYYEFELDNTIVFNSLHSIDYLDWKPKVKLLSDFDIIVSKKISLDVFLSSEKYVLKPGEALLAIPGQTTCISLNSVKKGVAVLHFSAGRFAVRQAHESSEEDGDLVSIAKITKMRNNYVFDVIDIMFDELKYKRCGFKKKLDICLHEILLELHRCRAEDIISGSVQYNYSTINTYTRKIIDFVHKNYARRINSGEIEALLNLNYDYINSVFKKMTGFTIMNYIDQIRISKAKQLIDSTDMKLYEIAFAIGMEDQHYFSKKFKKVEGISPSELKKIKT
jgi:AraC-like DNA-binding protein